MSINQSYNQTKDLRLPASRFLRSKMTDRPTSKNLKILILTLKTVEIVICINLNY